jgi:hypothetical protein
MNLMGRGRLFSGGCKGRLQKQRQHKDLSAVGSHITSTLAIISAAGLIIASAGSAQCMPGRPVRRTAR